MNKKVTPFSHLECFDAFPKFMDTASCILTTMRLTNDINIMIHVRKKEINVMFHVLIKFVSTAIPATVRVVLPR